MTSIIDFIYEMLDLTNLYDDLDMNLSDVLENAIIDIKDEMKYYANESKYALISPEFEGEYEVYQDTLSQNHKDLQICNILLKKKIIHTLTVEDFLKKHPIKN